MNHDILRNEISNDEFGMNYDQLAENEREWVNDELPWYNYDMPEEINNIYE